MSDYKYDYKQTSNSSSRAFYGFDSTPDGITIHHWGRDGQKHKNVVGWLRGAAGGTSNDGSSAHLVVSAGRVTRLEKDSRATWHAGNGEGNGRTIGIECRPEMSDGDWETLVEVCADLEDEHGSLKYFRHKDWKATECPGRYGDLLGELVKDVNAEHARRKSGGSKPAPSPKPAPKPKPKPKPAPSAKVWPAEPIKVNGDKTKEWHNAWVDLLERLDYDDEDLGKNFQKWLNGFTDPRTGAPYYDFKKYLHDGVMGRASVRALQRFLFDRRDGAGKRFYNGVADGDRGGLTVKAEKKYLNHQIQFLGKK